MPGLCKADHHAPSKGNAEWESMKERDVDLVNKISSGNTIATNLSTINTRDENGCTALFLSCDVINPNLQIVESLFKGGRSTNLPDITIGNNFKTTPLMSLCSNKSGENVNEIIKIIEFLAGHLHKRKSDINQKDSEGNTALMYACKNGQYQIVECLLNKNVGISKCEKNKRFHKIPNIATRNDIGTTPLMALCSRQCDDNIDDIIRNIDLLTDIYPPSINQKDKRGKHYLMYACEHGHYKIVKHLLQLNGENNTCDFKIRPNKIPDISISDKFETTPLMLLCSRNIDENIDDIIRIIDTVIDKYPKCINQKDKEGNNYLMYACKHGHYNIVKHFLPPNQEKSICDEEVRSNSIIDGTICDLFETTPLMLLCSRKSDENIENIIRIIDTVIDKNPRCIDQKDKEGNNYLMYACKHGHYIIVQHLLQLKGANTACEYDVRLNNIPDFTICNKFETTPLMLLCSRNIDENIENIIRIIDTVISEYPKCINQKDSVGNTALMYACKCGHYQIVEYLTNINVDINKLDKKSRFNSIPNIAIGNNCETTPLMALCSRKCDDNIDDIIRIIDYLIDLGPACFNQEDKEGKTCLMYACKHGHFKIVETLIQKNRDKATVDEKDRPNNIPNIKISDKFERTPLMLLCSRQNDENIDDIIRIINLVTDTYPAFINQKDKQEKSLLMYACQTGHYKIIDVLLQKIPKFTNSDNFLCEKKVSPIITSCDKFQKTPLMFLCSRKSDKNIKKIVSSLDYLIKHLSYKNISQEDFEGNTALMYACRFGHYEIIKKLLNITCRQGIINHSAISNKQGKTPLMALCSREFDKIEEPQIMKIIDVLTDVNSRFSEKKDKTGKTAIAYAGIKGNMRIMERLMQNLKFEKGFM